MPPVSIERVGAGGRAVVDFADAGCDYPNVSSSQVGVRRCVARERPARYDAEAPAPRLAEAVATLRAGLEQLAAADVGDAADGELGEALLALAEVQTRLTGQEARVLRTFDAREAYRADACVTAASWLRFRARLGHADAQRRCKRARVLRDMDGLRAALEAGEVSVDHVDAVVRRAIPQRLSTIVEHDATLTELARTAEPRHVAVAVARIVELADPDAADDPPPSCTREDLRGWSVRRGFDGLGVVDAATSPVLTELLLRVRDVFSTPDPPDTPPEQRRTPAQRFHDAVLAALTTALDHDPGSAVGGVRAHFVVFSDLQTLLGRDELARIRPRLGATGEIDAETARHLAATTDPTMRAVLGLVPWLPVSVGRARRTLPPFLRTASQLAHQHCRGPGCDRPYAWAEEDHNKDWIDGGLTALFNSAPLCEAHHQLKHRDGWSITFDPHTGAVTWISRDGTRRIDLPPPEP
jgi:hypothetical protein